VWLGFGGMGVRYVITKFEVIGGVLMRLCY
jgi:hypothetical protein